MKATLTVAVALLVLARCKEPERVASNATTSRPSSTTAAPPTPASSTPSAPAGELADAYRGTIDPSIPVVMRLRRTGRALAGTYLYEKTGGELSLAGTITETGELRLTETTANQKTTGSFDGRVGPGGELTGMWSDPGGGARRSFMLSPIRRRAGVPAIVVRHIKKSRTRSKVEGRNGVASACVLDASYAELFGLPDAKVEAELNDKLRHAGLDPEQECDVPDDVTTSYEVHLNRSDLLSVTFMRADNCQMCAHPSVGGGSYNFRTDTGVDIPLEHLLARGGKAKLAGLLGPMNEAHVRSIENTTPEDAKTLEDAYLQGAFALEESGLRLIAFFSLPHVAQGLDGQMGVVLPWAKITSALDPNSPARAAFKP